LSAANTDDALLLRAVDYAEADRIVTLLTREHGRASFIARGARNSRRRFAGALQPFHVLRVELKPARGPLPTLVQAQVSQAFPRLLTDLSSMGAAFAALELLRELTPEHQPDATIFEAAVELLSHLESGAIPARQLLIAFGLRLLALCGLAPQLLRCGLCGRAPAPGQASAFDAGEGHLVCQSCGGAAHRLGGALRARLQYALAPSWLDAAMEPWSEPELRRGGGAFVAFAEQRIGKRLQALTLLQGATEPRA
jgi:DNA repair protein RecO (recombination protein O)